MVASKQVEIPYYRAVGRQRGSDFGALAQVIGRTVIRFLRKNVVSAAKRIGADMLEFAAPEIGEVFRGRKSFKADAKGVGKKTLKKQLGEGEGSRRCTVGRKRLPAESFQQNLQNKSVGREETFLQTFLVDHVRQQISVPTFCGSGWKFWRESPNC